MINLLRLISRLLLPRRLHGNGCRFSWHTNADCAVNLICWGYYVRRFLL